MQGRGAATCTHDIYDAFDFCDGCGSVMRNAPLVKRIVGDVTYVFDTFECYAVHNQALLASQQEARA